MQFEAPLLKATLVKRYKRFLADVILESGEEITVHCPNTGAMTGCAEPGWTVWLSRSESKTRKYPHTWELVETDLGLASVHSAKANKVVQEAVEAGQLEPLEGYSDIRAEVKYGEGSRADLLLAGADRDCYVEVKSVTLCAEDGLGLFPDAVSDRARKHLLELQTMAEQGHRSVIFFCAFHTGVNRVAPARDIDPKYSRALTDAVAAGVEALAWVVDIDPEQGIQLARQIPVETD